MHILINLVITHKKYKKRDVPTQKASKLVPLPGPTSTKTTGTPCVWWAGALVCADLSLWCREPWSSAHRHPKAC